MSELTKMVLADEDKKTVEQQEEREKEGVGTVTPLPLIKDTKGQIKKNRANLTRLLTYHDEALKDLFVYNEATHNIEITEDRKLGFHELKKGAFSDITSKQIASYISNVYFLDYKPNEVADEVETVAVARSYHPIKSFLNKALINKDEGADPFSTIRKYLNIEDKPYNRLILDLFFRGAIARVFEPGCQFDYCLDLIGPQGGRKTSFLRQVFMNWYTDQINTFNQKDDMAIMIQAWAVNDDELEATKKMSFGGLKKAITVTQVTFRPPYGKATITVPVDFVFSRTTNEAGHLGDATGDRRFIGLEVAKPRPDQLSTMTETDLINIWGHYYKSYRENKKLYFEDGSPEMEMIEKEREKHKKTDETLELLQWYLDTLIPSDFYNQTVESYHRRGYYHDLQSTGVAYRTNLDKERGIEWQGVEIRDRVSISDTVNELFYDERRDRALEKKIRFFFDNLPDWEKRKNIKFGKRVTSGYFKLKR